jgi:hypothetical protein
MLIGQLAFRNQTEIQDSMDRIGQLARLDEWSRGRGDGVVSVKSAKLEGVTDFVTLPFSHNAFGKPVTPTAQMVIDEVIKRLPSP